MSRTHGCISLSKNNRPVAKTSGAPVFLASLSWCMKPLWLYMGIDAGSCQKCCITVLLGHTDDTPSLAPSGVRVFHSSPAASSLDYIGGPAILLGLISLATDDHTMYAAMKVLHSVLTSNTMCDYLMRHICGYQVILPSRLTLQLPKEVSFPRMCFSCPSRFEMTSGKECPSKPCIPHDLDHPKWGLLSDSWTDLLPPMAQSRGGPGDSQLQGALSRPDCSSVCCCSILLDDPRII